MQGETFERTEAWVRGALRWLELAMETMAALVIAIGVVLGILLFVRALPHAVRSEFQRVRLTMAHYLVLALEFLLAADIVATAVSPTWDHLGKLAAIAGIRTVLNFFLVREMKSESATVARETRDGREPESALGVDPAADPGPRHG